MKKGLTCLQIVIFMFSMIAGELLAQTLPLSPNLINLNSEEGERLLMESQTREDFLPLIVHFTVQQNKAYCGVASSVMVLNTLSIPAPETKKYAPFRLFTQDNFFNAAARKVVTPEVVAQRGMTLDQLGKLLEAHAVNTTVYHSADTSIDEFRTLAVKNLDDSRNFILINYLRKIIGQEKGGHISPLAAYHEKTDRFLILDVSRYKYPPVWVTAEKLWQSMATIDSDANKTRGFVVVSAGLK
jgi:hypothetical protein